jgi:coproporphyrinogen III oxidase
MPIGVILKCTMIAENNSAMVWWWSRFAIICLKKMQDIFIKRKTACDKHNPEFYPKYKNNVMPISGTHTSNEARGIGGLFFDYCKATDEMSMENWFNFVSEVGNSLKACSYCRKEKVYPILQNKKTWQEIRRGRYVEFNLVHDKGTLFGLKPMEELNLS